MSHAKSVVPRYVMITPARNEGRAIQETVERVVQQTMPPVEWVIVDDGSNDDTGAILDDIGRRYAWIRVLHRPDRGFRDPARGAIEAFLDGFKLLGSNDWHYIVNLDADMNLDHEYFEKCFAFFDSEPELGIGGGTVVNVKNGKTVIERNPRFHVRGATKIYRRACWDAMGGLKLTPGWDTLDEVKANMLGWKTRTFPDIQAFQRRATGSIDGAWRDCVKNGRAGYVCGYHPLFMFFKCLRKAIEPPFLIASLGLCFGYITGYLGRTAQINDPALISYLRTQQMRRLLLRDSIWK